MLFLLALVLPPYWIFIHPEELSIAVRLLTVAGGALWLYLASREVRITIGVQHLVLLLVLSIAALVLNLSALRSVIAWKGDESLHIRLTMALADRIPPYLLVLGPILAGLTLYTAARRSARFLIVVLVLDLLTIVPILAGSFWEGAFLGRWPFFSYWWLALAPALAKLVADPYHEFLFRIVPLISAATLAWILSARISRAGLAARILWGLAFLTIPIVLYYSSIVYFEMPAVCLMTVISLQAGDLLRDPFEDVRHTTGWLALLALGFIKETVVFFLLCFLTCRVIFAWQRNARASGALTWRSISHHLGQEAILAFCILFPAALYLAFRSFSPTGRSLVLDLSKLANAAVYGTLARSFVEQFGVVFALFLAGLALLFRNGDRRSAAFLGLILVATPLFFALDAGYGDFTGYSRYNLFVLPVVLAGAVALINRGPRWNRIIMLALPCVVIAINLSMSPINRDGTKQPGWGVYAVPTGEEYYPYDDALLFLRQNHPHERILFSGMTYPFPFEFYFEKFDWRPYPRYRERILTAADEESVALPAVLAEARRNRFALLLWHVQGRQLPEEVQAPDACLVEIFTNQAHTLLLFSTREAAAASPPCLAP
jgi:hypothetical protein